MLVFIFVMNTVTSIVGAAEPRQSCEPLSVLICPQHHISVLGGFFEITLPKFFKQHLIEGVL